MDGWFLHLIWKPYYISKPHVFHVHPCRLLIRFQSSELKVLKKKWLSFITVLIDINLLKINSKRGRIPDSIQTFRPLYFWRFLLSVISIIWSHYYIFTHNSFSIYYPDPITHTLFCDRRFFFDGFLLVV